jgi:hypothetical protein
MTKEIIEQFELLFTEFEYLEKNPESFPHKSSFADTPGLYVNVLSGQLSDGTVGSKTVYVKEDEGLLDAEVVMKRTGIKRMTRMDASFLTIYRSALVAAYTLWRARRLNTKIGFIGGGKINLMTAMLLSDLGASDFVVLGGRHNTSKNEGCFSIGTGKKIATGYENLRDCETLVVCTNNVEQEHLISREIAPSVSFVVVQDNGYTLSEDWRRDWIAFSDYPAQLAAHFKDEFPFDRRGKFKNRLFPINMVRGTTARAGVYLFGTIVADLVAAKYVLENQDWFESLGLEYNNAMRGFEK